MGKVEAAIFDLDGLLADTEPLYFQAESELARRYGKDFTRDVMEKMMGHKALRSIQIMIESLGIDGRAEEILGLRDTLYRNLLMKGVKPMNGVSQLLSWLEKHGYRKAIGTSSRTEFKDIILNHLGLHDRFEVVITGQEVSTGKPSPEIYQLVLHRLDLHPQQCIVLEDSAVGLKAAKGAGCFCIVVPNRFTCHQDFSQADLVVSDLWHPDIRQYFQRT
jgi:HAD superfamily hydrolase (TIGR01509 family)